MKDAVITITPGYRYPSFRRDADVTAPGDVGTRAIRVLIAEDMHMIRGALVALLSFENDMEVVAELERGDQVPRVALETLPDVAVLDIDLPGLDGLAAAESLAQAVPSCRVLILTGLSQPNHLLRALQAGARGFLLKDAPAGSLSDAIRRVSRGEHVIEPNLMAAALATGSNPLTPRETDVLRLANQGLTTEEIGAELALSPATVRNYMSSAMSKVGGRNRIDAIRIAHEAGWL
jgi:two-component system, NarL family, response regulator DesR